MKKKIKVLLASDFYTPHWTGIVKGISSLVTLLKEDAEFTILTVQYSADLPMYEETSNERIYRAKPFISLSRVKYSVHALLLYVKLVKSCDAVLINSPCSNILPFAIIAKIFRRKIIIFHQGDLVLREGIINRIIEFIFYLSTRIALSLSNSVSTYSRDYAENSPILRSYLKKFSTLIMPIEKPDNDTNTSKVAYLLKSHKNEGRILFGFAGRFVHEKGFDILFKAIPLVREKYQNAFFAFAGDLNIQYEKFFDEVREDYEKVKESVILLGLLKDSELWGFYSNIDFILIPSRSDCFNIVQAEACLAGAPSICSNIPGARVLVKETGFGVLSISGDPIDLAKKIIYAIENKDSLKSNYNKVVELFDSEKIRKTALSLLS